MRFAVGIFVALLIGFAAGWFVSVRRVHQQHAVIGLGNSLRLYEELMTTNVAEARSQVEAEIASLVMDAWATGLLKKNTNFARNVRKVSTNFVDQEIKAEVEHWLNEPSP